MYLYLHALAFNIYFSLCRKKTPSNVQAYATLCVHIAKHVHIIITRAQLALRVVQRVRNDERRVVGLGNDLHTHGIRSHTMQMSVRQTNMVENTRVHSEIDCIAFAYTHKSQTRKQTCTYVEI